MAKDVRFEGVYPILVTPFDDRENVDLESFARVVSFMADVGADGVTILGVLGESNRMVDAEREALIRAAAAAAAGRIPVVVGTSHRGTRAARGLSRTAESLGADAVLVAPSRETARRRNVSGPAVMQAGGAGAPPRPPPPRGRRSPRAGPG